MGKTLFMLDALENAVPVGTGSYLQATSAPESDLTVSVLIER